MLMQTVVLQPPLQAEVKVNDPMLAWGAMFCVFAAALYFIWLKHRR